MNTQNKEYFEELMKECAKQNIGIYIREFVLGKNNKDIQETEKRLWENYNIKLFDINWLLPSYTLQTRKYLMIGSTDDMRKYMDDTYSKSPNYKKYLKIFNEFDIIDRDKSKPFQKYNEGGTN